MSRRESVVIEVFGEGKTDVRHDPEAKSPTKGVVPILLYALCDKPTHLLVRCFGTPFMMSKGPLRRKVRFAKRQAKANDSAGAVFVVDSEGDLRARLEELNKGRQMERSDLPMAVGVAHPCIEAWLLADPRAIRRAFRLARSPEVPERPEQCPAPRQDGGKDPKSLLARAAGLGRHLSADECDRIAKAMRDVELVCQRCPAGFAPFAGEVRARIRPLFKAG